MESVACDDAVAVAEVVSASPFYNDADENQDRCTSRFEIAKPPSQRDARRHNDSAVAIVGWCCWLVPRESVGKFMDTAANCRRLSPSPSPSPSPPSSSILILSARAVKIVLKSLSSDWADSAMQEFGGDERGRRQNPPARPPKRKIQVQVRGFPAEFLARELGRLPVLGFRVGARLARLLPRNSLQTNNRKQGG